MFLVNALLISFVLGLLCGLNTKARYKRRLPREAVRSFANQLRRVRIRFNMAADSNTREVSLLVRSVSFFVLLLHITTQVQNIDENHCL